MKLTTDSSVTLNVNLIKIYSTLLKSNPWTNKNEIDYLTFGALTKNYFSNILSTDFFIYKNIMLSNTNLDRVTY